MNTFVRPFTRQPVANTTKFNTGRQVIHTLGNKTPRILRPTATRT